MIFICAWIAIFFESYIRLFKVQAINPRNVTEGEHGIRVNKASASYTHKTYDYRVEFKTNSKGLRADHEISYKKPEGVFRLMLLGDSFGMGYGAALEESFIQQAANLISKGLNKKVEVVNLSVSGYSTAEQVIALRQEGIKYSPDLIVSTWHHTDLDENMWSKLFVVENGQLSRKENSYLPGIKQRAMLENIPFYTFLSEHSQAYSFIREKTALMIKSMLRSKNNASQDAETELKKNELALALYLELDKIAELENVPLIVLNIPKKLERQIYKNTMPVMIRKNFIVVDPIETFEKTSGNLLYWERSQGHFTPTGNRLVGELLALQVINVIQSENRPK
jgi:hypothetical protein